MGEVSGMLSQANETQPIDMESISALIEHLKNFRPTRDDPPVSTKIASQDNNDHTPCLTRPGQIKHQGVCKVVPRW
jgi:hypothetical protein